MVHMSSVRVYHSYKYEPFQLDCMDFLKHKTENRNPQFQFDFMDLKKHKIEILATFTILFCFFVL